MARMHRIGLSRAAFVIGVGRASEDSDSPMLSNTAEVYAHKLPDTKAAAPFNDRKGSTDTLRRYIAPISVPNVRPKPPAVTTISVHPPTQ